MSDLEANKKVFRQYIRDWLDNKDMAHIVGPAIMAETLKTRTLFLGAFPDLDAKVLNLIAEGDKVCGRMQLSGTHKGQFMQFAPTGKRIEFTLLRMATVENGKLTETWAHADFPGLMKQLSEP